jgi:CRP-like cAMP-binding protein
MIDELKRGMLFARLSSEQMQRVASHARRLRLDEGQSLFHQGDRAERFYYLLAGQIKLYRLSPSGNEKVIEIVTPGSTFAEALMFLDRPRYPVGAMTLQPAEVISLDAGDFVDMLADSVQTCFLLMGDMSQRLRGLIQEIDELSLHSATCRVAGYLLTQAESVGEFELQVPKQTLASRLSVKPETFSRIIKQLSERDVLKVKGSRVEIHDRSALKRIADACALPSEGRQ